MDNFFSRIGKGEVSLLELQTLQREIFERCKTQIIGSASVPENQRAEVMVAYSTAARAVAEIGNLIQREREHLNEKVRDNMIGQKSTPVIPEPSGWKSA